MLKKNGSNYYYQDLVARVASLVNPIARQVTITTRVRHGDQVQSSLLGTRKVRWLTSSTLKSGEPPVIFKEWNSDRCVGAAMPLFVTYTYGTHTIHY